jgi:hypothetical protein
MVLCWKTFPLAYPFLSGSTFKLLDCAEGTHSDTNCWNTEREVNQYFTIIITLFYHNLFLFKICYLKKINHAIHNTHKFNVETKMVENHKNFLYKTFVRTNLQKTPICNNLCTLQPIGEANPLTEHQLIQWAPTHKIIVHNNQIVGDTNPLSKH